jgi:hypothetical protein
MGEEKKVFFYLWGSKKFFFPCTLCKLNKNKHFQNNNPMPLASDL